MEDLPLDLLHNFVRETIPWSRYSTLITQNNQYWIDKIEYKAGVKLEFTPRDPKKLYFDIQRKYDYDEYANNIDLLCYQLQNPKLSRYFVDRVVEYAPKEVDLDFYLLVWYKDELSSKYRKKIIKRVFIEGKDVKVASDLLAIIDPNKWIPLNVFIHAALDISLLLVQDGRLNLENYLVESAEEGSVKAAKFLLSFTPATPFVLKQACLYNQSKVVEILLETGIKPSYEDLRVNTMQDHAEIVKLLLDTKAVGPEQKDMDRAVAEGYTEIVKLFLRYLIPTEQNLIVAIRKGYEHIVEILLEDGRVDPAFEDNYPIFVACDYGEDEVVRLLLQDERVDPAADNSIAFAVAITKWSSIIVRLFLEDGRVDTSVSLIENYKEKKIEEWDQEDINDTFRISCISGYYGMFRALFRLQNVNLMNSLRNASEHGNVDIVKDLLLVVEPTQWILDVAIESNQVEVVKLLLPLLDPRKSIHGFEEAIRHDHVDVVKLLLEDGRIRDAFPKDEYYRFHVSQEMMDLLLEDGILDSNQLVRGGIRRMDYNIDSDYYDIWQSYSDFSFSSEEEGDEI